MYDSYIDGSRFRSFMGQMDNVLFGASDREIERLEASIEEAYHEGELSSSQYDKLMSTLGDLLEV